MDVRRLFPVFLPAIVACTWETELPEGARSIAVAPEREILVSDEAVLAPLSRNDRAAPLSYRRVTEGLTLADDGATLRWLESWSRRLEEEGAPDRARILRERVTCRWMRSVPANACDDACGACAGHSLALEFAPFRLIAVANRTDLSVLPDRAGDGGEGRLVFAATNGPADDPRSASLPLTVIFEYAQTGRALEWSERWHALGSAAPVDFPRALGALADGFVGAGTLAQIRTGDALTGPLILHQFERDRGELVARNVRNTLDFARVPPKAVQTWAHEHESAIAEGTAVMPSDWWASSSAPSDVAPSWVGGLPRHDDFVRASCGGCHARSTNGFQIDPLASGRARLSAFLTGEIDRRVEWMQLTLWKR